MTRLVKSFKWSHKSQLYFTEPSLDYDLKALNLVSPNSGLNTSNPEWDYFNNTRETVIMAAKDWKKQKTRKNEGMKNETK